MRQYLRKTKLVVPAVVAEECEFILANEVKGKTRKVEETLRWLGRFFGEVKGWQAPSDEAIEKRAKVLAKAHHLGAIMLPESDKVHERAELRSQAERPPGHQSLQLNDCRIWEQCLELLANQDVLFVSADRDFCGHRNPKSLHPELQAEAEEMAGGRSLTFHRDMESLLSDVRSEIPSIPKQKVFTFLYTAISADIHELESNSGCHPKSVGEVKQIPLTTDQAEVIEIRLEVYDKWKSSDSSKVADFRFDGSCQYRLQDNQLSDLVPSRVALLFTHSDGSVRAVGGSYSNTSVHIYAGTPPIQSEHGILR